MKRHNYSRIAQVALIFLSLFFLTAAKPIKVVVNAASPNSAEQGTTVPILITGSGFAPGATVAFWRTGTTNPGGVTVLAVTVHDSQSITADIDVALAADIDNYDIEVQLSSRRKGKGTELFSVKQQGGGNQTDACVISTTFPTFAFWGLSGQTQSAGLFLSDATGACVQQVTPNGGPCLLSEMKLRYEPPALPGGTGNGRVVSYCFDDAFLTDFSVASDNSVTVSKDTILIASVAGSGGIGGVDIATDGDSLAFSHHWADGNGDGHADGESLYIVSADDCLISPWLDTDPTSCNASGARQEILSVPNTNIGDSGVRWTGVSWNHDRTRIYLNQSKHTEVSGIEVAEKDAISGNWSPSGVVSQVTLGGVTTFPEAAYTTWDSRGDREVVAFRLNDDAPCSEIHIIDVEDCRGPSALCGSIGPELIGTRPSFTNDGQLVFMLLKQKGRHSCNNQNKIVILDPFATGSTSTEVVNGTDPDG